MTRTILGRSAAALLLVGGCVLGPAPAAHAEYDYSYAVSADGLGNAYIAGETDGDLDGPNAGLSDAFLSKYDAAGNFQWTRQLGTASIDASRGVTADSMGNVYISGGTFGSLDGSPVGFNDDAFTSKYDAAGNLQWTRQLGSPVGERSYGVSADGLGNIYIAGTTEGSLGGPSAGAHDAFVAKYDSAGDLKWTRQLGTADYDNCWGVSADALGSVFIAGQTSGNLDQPNVASPDAFVAKYDAAGALQWTRQMGTNAFHSFEGVSADGLGNVYLTGHRGSGSATIALLTKFDGAGNLQWTRELGAASINRSEGISADALGNVYISGDTTGALGGPNAGSYDAFVSKYDAAGALQWTRQYGTASSDFSRGVSHDGLGNVFISGNLAEYDAFIARYDAAGNFQWATKLRDNIPEPASWLLAALAGAAVLTRRGQCHERTTGLTKAGWRVAFVCETAPPA
jgi:hypothetical protein